ncbi:MAG: pyridoxamine 5'-phosphate oxidase family protein [Chloroflexota bacterium]|nr:pyridoxamine 5'-phosphate oxidase family protein [Chloroflexota bacterium]
MYETVETMHRLEEIIELSAARAGPAMRQNFAVPAWTMSAEEFVAFWGEGRMASVSTASARGDVHVAPLDVQLIDGVFRVATFADALRLGDHRARPRCAISSWDGPYRAVIVYGDAREAGSDGVMVTVEIAPSRIYAIRPPAGHHSLTP